MDDNVAEVAAPRLSRLVFAGIVGGAAAAIVSTLAMAAAVAANPPYVPFTFGGLAGTAFVFCLWMCPLAAVIAPACWSALRQLRHGRAPSFAACTLAGVALGLAAAAITVGLGYFPGFSPRLLTSFVVTGAVAAMAAVFALRIRAPRLA